MGEEFKVFKNNKNNQLFISLSRKRLNLKKDDNPVSIEMERIKLNFLKKKREGLL